MYTSLGRKDFTVQGIFEPVGIGEVFGGNIAIMDVYSAQVIFNRGRNFDRIDLMNSPDVPVETVQKNLRAKLPAGFEIVPPQSRGQDLESAVTAMRVGLTITSFTALLVGIYIIFNSFTIAINQRWKEIGILRAVGVERGNINLMFLFEAFLMGVIGSLHGHRSWLLLGRDWGKSHGQHGFRDIRIDVHLDAGRFQHALCNDLICLGVAASVFGAWFPARAASQLDPTMALHNIEARNREAVLGWRRVTVGLVLTLSSLALMIWTPSSVGATFQFSYAILLLLGLTTLLPKLIEIFRTCFAR